MVTGRRTLAAPDKPGRYTAVVFVEGKDRFSNAGWTFFEVVAGFRITKIEPELSTWVGPGGKWLDIVITYEGTPTGPLGMNMRWITCPPTARCSEAGGQTQPEGEQKVRFNRFGFCSPLTPAVYDNEIRLRDAKGAETPWQKSGVTCAAAR